LNTSNSSGTIEPAELGSYRCIFEQYAEVAFTFSISFTIERKPVKREKYELFGCEHEHGRGKTSAASKTK
jgi:hypothetical protein